MSRPAEYTRGSIIKAAVHLFAEKGFQGASVRDIVVKARVNQAAINYHFKGKDGLYLEVLKTALEKLTEHAGSEPEKLKSLSREEALRSFVYQQLRPLLFRDEMSRYIRLFAWESAHPSKIFLKFMATNTGSYLTTAVDIVRRIPTSRHTETDRPMRGHLAHGPMQHFRAEPRAIRARAVRHQHRRVIHG